MAIETVDILVQSDEVAPEPVDGVTVRVYDAAGAALITSGVTGTVVPGRVEFSLEGSNPATVYQLRFHLNGGSIVSPQQIAVYSPPAAAPSGANLFEVEATLFSLPPAADHRLCRCSGHVRGPDGIPRRGIDMHFIPCFNPLVVEGMGVLGERVRVKSDKAGFVQVDLYRNGIYRATIESHENIQREVVVPDRSSVNLNHLLFPVVAAVSFDPPGPWSIPAGAELEIEPTIRASDFRVLEGTGDADVTYAVDDTNIAHVAVRANRIYIRGLVVGATSFRVGRRDRSIVYIPDLGIGGAVVAVSVT
jgi:hypothetical protein